MRNILRPTLPAVLALLLAACAPAASTPVSEYAGVRYYPACGNEVLTHDGTTWYPFLYDESVRYPAGYGREGELSDSPEASGQSGSASEPLVLALGLTGALPRVAPPGPGDDVGALTVFSGGIAFFESDSGDLSIWLTDQPREYNWEC